jgi:hypothetical protein
LRLIRHAAVAGEIVLYVNYECKATTEFGILGMSVGPVKMHLKIVVVEKYVVNVNGFSWLMTVSLTLNMVLFISHNTTSFYSLFIQAHNVFRPMF